MSLVDRFPDTTVDGRVIGHARTLVAIGVASVALIAASSAPPVATVEPLLPVGLLAVLAMIVGWFLGVTVADLPSRVVPTEQAPVTIAELARQSRWQATLARSFVPVLSCVLLGGALFLMVTFQSLFPGPIGVGLSFTLFGSLACLSGFVRGAYEAGLGVGPELRDPIAPDRPIRFSADSPNVRQRGSLRLATCGGAIPILFVVGGHYPALLGSVVTVAFIGYLFHVGGAHVLDGVTTLRGTGGTDGRKGIARVVWGGGAVLFLLFGLAHLVLGSYLVIGFWRMLQHAGALGVS